MKTDKEQELIECYKVSFDGGFYIIDKPPMTTHPRETVELVKMEKDEYFALKMQKLMYALTKTAAQRDYSDYLKNLEITENDYDEIKRIWKERLNITPYV